MLSSQLWATHIQAHNRLQTLSMLLSQNSFIGKKQNYLHKHIETTVSELVNCSSSQICSGKVRSAKASTKISCSYQNDKSTSWYSICRRVVTLQTFRTQSLCTLAIYKLMKLRADDQAAQPQKREISSFYFPAEFYRPFPFFFFFQSASCVLYLYWSKGA